MSPRTLHVTVRGLLAAHPEQSGLSLELLAGAAGLDRPITSPSIQKTGLALAGFHSYLQPGRVLIYGESELQYLESLPLATRRAALAHCFATEIPCVLLSGGGGVPEGLHEEAEAAGLPLLVTPAQTAVAISRISALLGDRLAVREMVHGVLLEILGLGVLIVGESGIGKSECALDLVGRGHRLVADDTVEIRRREDMTLLGSCPPLTRNHMEVRGLGLINIRDLFGVAATRVSKRIELTVQLERWDSVAAAAEQVRALGTPIDMLICNAGIMALPQLEQVYGLEKQFVVNHLGHFILVNRLLDQVRAAPQGRVVAVSSMGYRWAPAGGIEFDNLSGERGYEPNKMYGQSKLANMLMVLGLAERLAGTTTTANAVHPGVINTNLGRHFEAWKRVAASLIGWTFMKSVEAGAATTCYVATAPALAGTSGQYFEDCNPVVPQAGKHMDDRELAARLWARSEELTREYLG